MSEIINDFKNMANPLFFSFIVTIGLFRLRYELFYPMISSVPHGCKAFIFDIITFCDTGLLKKKFRLIHALLLILLQEFFSNNFEVVFQLIL